jgi:hypothetical protein
VAHAGWIEWPRALRGADKDVTARRDFAKRLRRWAGHSSTNPTSHRPSDCKPRPALKIMSTDRPNTAAFHQYSST